MLQGIDLDALVLATKPPFASEVRHELVGNENGTPSTLGIQMAVADGRAWAANHLAAIAGGGLPDASPDLCAAHHRKRCRKCRRAESKLPPTVMKCAVARPDSVQAQRQLESSMLQRAKIARCLRAFITTVDDVTGFPELSDLRARCTCRGTGEIVVAILRTYDARALRDTPRALEDVAAYAASIDIDENPPTYDRERAKVLVRSADRVLTAWCERFDRSWRWR